MFLQSGKAENNLKNTLVSRNQNKKFHVGHLKGLKNNQKSNCLPGT